MLKNGQIIEQGTHKELLEKNGYYAGLVRSQLAQDELESKEENLDPLTKRKSSVRHGSFMGSNYSAGQKNLVISIDKEDIKLNRCRLFTEIKDHKIDVVLASLGAAIVGALNPISGLIMSNSMSVLSDDVLRVKKKSLKWPCMCFVLGAGNFIGNFLMIWKYTTLGVTLANIFRKKILKKYLKLHIAYFDIDSNAPGALLTKLAIDTMQLNSIILSMIGSTVNCGMVIIVGFSMGFYYSWRLTLIIICFIPIISFSIFIRTQLRHGSGRRAIEANIEAGSILSECVVNTKTIYSFNFQKKAVEMYLDVLKTIREKFSRDAFINGLFLATGQFAIFCAQATVFAGAKKFLVEGKLEADDMAMTICIVLTTAGGIGQGLSQIGDYKKANVAFKSLYSIIDTQSLIPPFKEDNINKKSAANIKGKIEFRDVIFAYPTRPDQIILKKISFVINPGEAAALVGYSGCGKSTIIQLLERFYDVEDGKGEILIDDVNIKDYNLYELRKKIGLVSQEPILFKRSVLENVRYGKLNATDEECIEAARKANIMKFFEGDKMHQILDDGDKNGGQKKDTGGVGKKEDPVSGGEKQRLAIARAFLKDPVILLLDEATSALDKDSEIEVQKSLDKLAGGRTSITIAHRLSTIENSDMIYVLESGKIVEKGKHEELMKLKAKYYTLHKYSEMN
jgi:ABC-type multidrug transport system fused ATPase/permease subunit